MERRQIVLNVPVEVRRWLEQQAAQQERSMNYIASQALDKARREHERKAA